MSLQSKHSVLATACAYPISSGTQKVCKVKSYDGVGLLKCFVEMMDRQFFPAEGLDFLS